MGGAKVLQGALPGEPPQRRPFLRAMTTASTAVQSALQGSSAWRLIVAVGLVLGATAFTVRSFVQSTGDESSGPGSGRRE